MITDLDVWVSDALADPHEASRFTEDPLLTKLLNAIGKAVDTQRGLTLKTQFLWECFGGTGRIYTVDSSGVCRRVFEESLPDPQVEDALVGMNFADYSKVYIYGGGSFTDQHWDYFETSIPKLSGVADRSEDCFMANRSKVWRLSEFNPAPGSLILISCPGYEEAIRAELTKKFGEFCTILPLTLHRPLELLRLGERRESSLPSGAWSRFQESIDSTENAEWACRFGIKEIAINQFHSPTLIRPLAASPGPRIRSLLHAEVQEFVSSQIGRAMERASQGPFVVGEVYSDFAHVLGPYLWFLDQLHKAGLFESCVLIVTDSVAVPESVVQGQEWLILVDIRLDPNIYRFLDVSETSRGEWEARKGSVLWPFEFEGFDLDAVFMGQAERISIYQSALSPWIQQDGFRFFINIIECHALSQVFILESHFSTNPVPLIWFQHGIISRQFDPQYSTLLVTWRDLATREYLDARRVGGKCFELGSVQFDRVASGARDYKAEPDFDIVFFAQDPVCLVSYILTAKAIAILKEVVRQRARSGCLLVKSRRDESFALFRDAFAEEIASGWVTVSEPGGIHASFFGRGRWVGVISSGAALEARHLGLNVFSIEDGEIEGIVRFSRSGISMRVDRSEDLLQLLNSTIRMPPLDLGLRESVVGKVVDHLKSTQSSVIRKK